MPGMVLGAGARKIVYLDKTAMDEDQPAYLIRTQGYVLKASGVSGHIDWVQANTRLMDDGPKCYGVCDRELTLSNAEVLTEHDEASIEAVTE